MAPESRTDFYRKVADELLIKRRLKQTGPQTSYAKLREQRQQILGRVALNHILNPAEAANSLPWKTAIDVVSSVMKHSD